MMTFMFILFLIFTTRTLLLCRYEGLWIQCSNELCSKWQHGNCFGHLESADVPPTHKCHECRPEDECRPVDHHVAAARKAGLMLYAAAKAGDIDSVQTLLASGKGKGTSTANGGGGGGRGGGHTKSSKGKGKAKAKVNTKGKGRARARRSSRRQNTDGDGNGDDADNTDDNDDGDDSVGDGENNQSSSSGGGVSVDWINVDERTKGAIHAACEHGHAAVAALLLKHGADQARTDLDNKNCFALAAAGGHAECITVLRAAVAGVKDREALTVYGSRTTPLLHLAAASADTAALELLSTFPELKASLDDVDPATGYTPLAVAAVSGSSSALRFLVDCGCFVKYRGAQNETLLHLAAGGGDLACLWVLERLLPKGKINEPDAQGWPPLLHAAANGHAAAIKWLLRQGAASLVRRDHAGTTALHLAALGGHTDAVEMLVQCGHPVDEVDNAGWPPLLYANFQANEQCVLTLLNAKPDHLRVLGVLLRQTSGTDDQRRRNRKVVAAVVTSLAMHDSYYKVLNDIVRGDPSLYVSLFFRF